MNKLSEIFSEISSNSTVTLEQGVTYSISPEDSLYIKNVYLSNTAKKKENSKGERFCGILLQNKENIIIDGNGATLMIHGIMTPFLFINCKNITLKNLTFDHFRPTMSEFTVVKSENGKATIKINDEFLYSIKGSTLYWESDLSQNGVPYWKIPYKGNKVLSNAYLPEENKIDDITCGKGDKRSGFPDVIKTEELQKGLLKLHFRDTEKQIPVGTVIQTRCTKRLQTGGAFDSCCDVYMENITIKSMNCFGILAQNCHNITYHKLNCTPGEGRTNCSDADFFHFSGCSGKIKITECTAIGAHDDVINVHGTHLRIIKLNRKKNTIKLRYMHPETWGFMPYLSGEKIEFISGNTLIPYFETQVVTVKKINDTDFLITVQNLPNTNPAKNDVIENISKTAEVYIGNNHFERIPTRAILCTTRKDAIIENNVFESIGGPALCVADDANFWFESGKSGKIVFEGNKISNCSLREENLGSDIIRYEPVVIDKASTTPVHKEIVIKNNVFNTSYSDKYALNLNYLSKALISGNESNVPIENKFDETVNYTIE